MNSNDCSERKRLAEELIQGALISNLLSFIVGGISSFAVWWGLNHIWLPRIKFGEEICKYAVSGNKALYVCALENSGSRDIIDIEVITRIGIKKFKSSESWIYFSIKTNASEIPVLEPGRRALVRVFDEREAPTFIDRPPPSLRAKIDVCKSLEELLSLSPLTEVRVHIFGYDSFSGARRHFGSPTYSKNDIRSGRLKRLVVVKA